MVQLESSYLGRMMINIPWDMKLFEMLLGPYTGLFLSLQ